MNTMNQWTGIAAIATLLVAFGGMGAAQTQTPDASPGFISPSNPATGWLYGVDVAVDDARVDFGVADPGEVAVERAAEVREVVDANDTAARERAVTELNEVAAAATNQSTQGLEKAQQVLQAVREQAPSQAQTGLDNIQEAKDRQPDQGPEGAADTPAGRIPELPAVGA